MSRRREQLLRMKRSNPTAEHSDHGKTDEELRWNPLGAAIYKGEYGSFVHRRMHYDLTEAHGRHRLGELSMDLAALNRLLKTEDKLALDREKLLFFDTETTGLGVGTGNLPFMIGLGYFENQQFIVEQCMVRHPGEEPAMLSYLQELLHRRPALVSFNGKSFDWPILKSRFVMNRLQPAESLGKWHFDLLHPSRRLWKQSLPSCRLSEIERHILKLQRVDDVPGYLAPELYFQFLKEQNPSLLKGVFMHNALDILSLVTLAIHLSFLLNGEWDADNAPLSEGVALANWLQDLNHSDLAGLIFQKVTLSPRLESAFIYQAALYWKRRGQWKEAVALWRRCVPKHAADISRKYIEPCLELAKFFEHKQKDYDMALHYATIAHQQLRGLMQRTRSKKQDRNTLLEMEHRLSRLKKKIQANANENNLQEFTLF